jgi:hypothetical protein
MDCRNYAVYYTGDITPETVYIYRELGLQRMSMFLAQWVAAECVEVLYTDY